MDFEEKLREQPVFEYIARAAQLTGLQTFAVGGYVRDLLLNIPSKDIDIVCVGSGIALAEKVAELSGQSGKVTVFKNFGTAMLRIGDHEVEFVGARKESYRSDSRKPVVEDGSLEDDQKRRDFTINALALSLNREDFGRLIDPFGGTEDLRKGVIKTPLEPEITFSDDPLRILRGVRFASRLNFDIEADTFAGMRSQKDRLSIVSFERISDELNKLIMTDKPSYGFKLLDAAGVLDYIFPEFVKLKGTETIDGKSHKDNFYHTLQVLDNVCTYGADLWLRWAAVLHDIAKPQTKRFHKKAGWTFHGHEDKGARMVPGIFRRLKLPMNEKMRFVQKLVRLHLRPIALVKETVTDSAVRRLLFEAGEDSEALMKLCRADITSKDHNKVKRFLQNFDNVEQKMIDIEESDKVRNFQPVVDGELIMNTFGLKPGREVGKIKIAVREAVLDGKIRNVFDEAYDFMVLQGEYLGLKPVGEKPKAPVPTEEVFNEKED